ncbi:MAG: hypothetical protein JSS07_07485 [Proteobacteria bacterium]|nr:hypothetical protein [Pseudomonadota bacterium]
MRFNLFIFCLLIASEAFAVRGDGSRIQNFRNAHPNYNNGTVIIQQDYGYPNYYSPYGYGLSFNPSDAYSYRDKNGNLIYYTTDIRGNTVYFRYNADGQIVFVDPLHP